MSDTNDQEEIVANVLAKNPHIDPEKIRESRELLRRLREKGLRRKEYDLAPPYGGRRVVARDDPPQPVPLHRVDRGHGTS